MFLCRKDSEKEHLWTVGGFRRQIILLTQGKLVSGMNIAIWEILFGEKKRSEEHMDQTENEITWANGWKLKQVRSASTQLGMKALEGSPQEKGDSRLLTSRCADGMAWAKHKPLDLVEKEMAVKLKEPVKYWWSGLI